MIETHAMIKFFFEKKMKIQFLDCESEKVESVKFSVGELRIKER